MQMQASKAASASAADYVNVGRALDGMRDKYLNTLKASSAFDVRQVQTISQTEAYTRALKEQKVHLGEAWKNRKLMNSVIKEQIDLQRAQAISWRKDGQGRILSDLVIPRDSLKGIDTARIKLGAYNEMLRSVGNETVKWGKNTQWAGRQLMVGFTVPLAIVAGATGKMAYDMDKALTQITKVYGDATQEMQDSTEEIRTAAMQTAKTMAATYGQSAKDTLEIEAQFAAAGKTGMELQQATAAATKARMLNEMDLQTAIQASITMQTVYGYTAEELGQKWEYINAVANQTILGAEDFATAIPKVAGINKELGGTIEDLGVLMTAFKAAGIDAAEGANALKTISFRAVSAYGKGLDTFKKMTGKDLQEIVNQTNGETIPTLMRLYEAMNSLSTPQKIAVVKDVFGIYQGNKALLLLEQMAAAQGQVAQALAVGKNSVAENAAIANQELERMNQQPYKQIEKAIERIKIEMAELGQVVLPMISGIVNAVAGFLDWLNDMPDVSKRLLLIAGAAVAIVGPLTMLLGLFGNLFGNVMKLQAAFGGLITRFKFTDAAERAQMLIGKQATSVWDQQTSAVARLTQQLQMLNNTFAETAALQSASQSGSLMVANTAKNQVMFGPYLPSPGEIKTDKNGNPLKPSGSASGWSRYNRQEQTALYGAMHAREMEEINKKRAYAALKEEEIAKAQKEQIANQRTLARNAGAGIATAGLMATMFGPSGGIIGTLSQVTFAVGTIMTMAPKAGVALTKGLAMPFVKAGAVAKEQVAKMRGMFTGLGTAIKGWASAMALPVAAAATAAVIYWQKVSSAADEANEKAKAYINSAKALAEMSGVNWQDATGVPDANMTGEERFANRAEEFRKKFAEEAQAIVDNGAEFGDKWGLAIAKGAEIRLHGGSVEAAKEATRTILSLMGENLSDEEFEIAVNAKINFENPDDLVRTQLDAVQRALRTAMNDLGTGMERWDRDNGVFGGFLDAGQDDLTKSARTLAENAGQEFFQGLRSINDPRQRKEVWDTFVEENTKDIREVYAQLRRAGGINDKLTFEDFVGNKNNVTKNRLKTNLGMSDEEIDDTLRRLEAVKYAMQGIASQTGDVSSSQLEDIFSPEQVEKYLANLFKIPAATKDATDAGIDQVYEYKQMHQEYGDALDKAAQQDENLSEAERLKLLNIVRANHGMAAATSLAQGFNLAMTDAADGSMSLADALKNIGSSLTEEQAIEAYKNTIESTTSDAADYALDLLDKQGERRADALEKEADDVEKSFDNREKAMEDKYEARTERLKKKQEDRRKGVEAFYDSRIKKIQDTIDAEKAADDERQRIFEAEQRRLQRMSELYNRNVDLNAAITSGNFDEAAKIANDMAASTQQWSAEDSNARAGAASEARQKALEAQKDKLEESKRARLDSLKAIEDAEEKALARDKERAKERLDAARDASKAEYEDKKRRNAQITEENKRRLKQELDMIRAQVPRNKKEMDIQMAQMQKAYEVYGGKLKDNGTAWSKYVGDQFLYHQTVSANKIKSDIAWSSIGATISKALLKGGFGMTAAQFTAWLNGGKAPAGSVFAPKAKPRIAGEGSQGGITRHKGGIIDDSKGSRAGYSGKNLSQSEVMVQALKGEAVLNRKATDFLGEENINAINSGKLPKNTGPWDMGMGGMAAAMQAGVMKKLMDTTLQAVVRAKAEQVYGAGSMGGEFANVKLSQEQLNNAMTIMDVGRSMGASTRDLQIALMTAMQESTLRNLNYGDRDSLGLFQQRPSQGWGKAEQIMNPRYASRKFFESLFRVKNRNNMPLTLAAQAVQRSAFPMAYARWEQLAKMLVGGNTGFGSGINMGQYLNGGNGAALAGGWYRPTSGGRVTSEYGMRVNPVTGAYRLHGGIDLGVPTGTPIFAAQRGIVSRAGWENSRGNFTTIDHGAGQKTGYAHQSRMFVQPGQVVTAGQRIGLSGNTGNSTGPHLHFEYYKDGQRLNPRMIIPKFKEGAYTLSTGLAELHPRETVLSEPLSNDLHEGLGKFAEGGNAGYHITMDFRGATIKSDVDIQKGVEKAIENVERRKGVSRKLGDK